MTGHKGPIIRARHVVNALRRHRYTPMEWAFIQELWVGPGRTKPERRHAEHLHKFGADTDWDPTDNYDSIVDVWTMHKHRDIHVAIEIKIDPADFERELTDPDKRAPAMAVSNLFYFAAPHGLIDPDELPDGCGLIEVDTFKRPNSTLANYCCSETVKPEWRDIEPFPRSFIASLALRAS